MTKKRFLMYNPPIQCKGLIHMEKRKLLHEAAAKRVYATEDPALLILEYTDITPAGKKGILYNQLSSHLMKKLEEAGIPTHFSQTLSPHETAVKKTAVLPLQVLVRNAADQAFASRFGVAEGIAFVQPILELYYQNEALGNPLVNTQHILALKLATIDEVVRIKDYATRANKVIRSFWQDHGIILADVRLEFGKLSCGTIVLCGNLTPDTCRLWDKETEKSPAESIYQEILQQLNIQE